MPEVNTPNRVNIIREAALANENDLAIGTGLLGPFTMMFWYLMDFENFSMLLLIDPELVHEMVDAYVE